MRRTGQLYPQCLCRLGRRLEYRCGSRRTRAVSGALWLETRTGGTKGRQHPDTGRFDMFLKSPTGLPSLYLRSPESTTVGGSISADTHLVPEESARRLLVSGHYMSYSSVKVMPWTQRERGARLTRLHSRLCRYLLFPLTWHAPHALPQLPAGCRPAA